MRAGAWSGEAKEGRPQGQCQSERAACMAYPPPPRPCFLLLPGPHSTHLFLVRMCVCGVPSPALWSGSGRGSSALSGLGGILEGHGQAPGLCRGARPVAVVSDPHPWAPGLRAVLDTCRWPSTIVCLPHALLLRLVSGLLCWIASCRGHGLGARQPGLPFSLCKSASSLPPP